MSVVKFGCQSPARPHRSSFPSMNCSQYGEVQFLDTSQQLIVSVIGHSNASANAWFFPKISYSCNSRIAPLDKRRDALTRSAGPNFSATSCFESPIFKYARLDSDFSIGFIIPQAERKVINNPSPRYRIRQLCISTTHQGKDPKKTYTEVSN